MECNYTQCPKTFQVFVVLWALVGGVGGAFLLLTKTALEADPAVCAGVVVAPPTGL